jgi:uncharacterized iron-regulated membrane protein
MTLGERLLRRPQSLWLRKALFQIHLWTGIGVGLYVLMISITGSAIVFRNEIFQAAGKPMLVAVSGPRLAADEIKQIVRSEFPGYAITFFWEAKRPDQATEVWMEHNGKQRQRLFDPYTGKDLGNSIHPAIRVVSWLSDLHTDLLFKKKGRVVNGVFSMVLTILCVTGALIWWPGTMSWVRSVIFNPKANWKRLNWELHSVAGLWTFALVFMWAVTGVYVVFPAPFQRGIDHYFPLREYRLEPLAQAPAQKTLDAKFVLVADTGKTFTRRRYRPNYSTGDKIVRWLTYLHFGNFAGWRTKTLWVILGLSPSFLFLTGALMWWNRVLSPAFRQRIAPSLDSQARESQT